MEEELPSQGDDEAEVDPATPPTNKEKANTLADGTGQEKAAEPQGQGESAAADKSSADNSEAVKENDSRSEERNEPAVANENSLEDNDSPEGPVAETVNAPKFCTKCGTPLYEAAAFCTKCGNPVGGGNNRESAITPAKPEQENTSGRTKEKASFIKKIGTKKIGTIAAIAVIVIAALMIASPMIGTPDELFAAGKYKAAYEKSAEDAKPEMLGKIIEKGKYDVAYSLATSDNEKKKVLLGACSAGKFEDALQLAETTEQKDMISFVNGIAYMFKTDCLDSLKDSDSFVLKKAWYGGRTNGIALQIQASNSYGQPVQNYYYFDYSSSKGRFEYDNSVSSLEDETVYRYDDLEERLEKYLDNATRRSLRRLTVESYAIDSDVVDAINNLFKATKFKDIALAPDLSIKEFGTLSGGEGAA